jgi:hypothetical protein
MRVKSQDGITEGLKRILPKTEEPLAGDGAADLEALFLAELRARRERLARWMQVIQEEVARESRQSARHRSHKCRSRRLR